MLPHSWLLSLHRNTTDFAAIGGHHAGPHVHPDDDLFVAFTLVAATLVCIAGLASGLTLSLMSLDVVELEVLRRSGTELEQKYAERIMPVIKNPHQLLVTLVLINAAATEALPIFLDRLANPYTAVLVSIIVVLVFGEILPQAFCSQNGLAVGAHSAAFVRILMWVTAPLAWPVSKLLDCALGEHRSAIKRRRQLKCLVEVHSQGEAFGGTLSDDEVGVIQGALDMSRKTAQAAMTPLNKVFMLSSEAVLDEQTLQSVMESGHSRVPVYEGHNREAIVGCILVKELAWVDKSNPVPVASLKMRSIPTLPASIPLFDLLRLFQTGRSHMALLVQPITPVVAEADRGSLDGDRVTSEVVQLVVQADGDDSSGAAGDVWKQVVQAAHEVNMGQGAAVGIITLEDILEELLQREIVDETDRFVDNERRLRVNAANILASLPPHLRDIVQSKMFLPRVGRLSSLTKRASLAEGLNHTSYTPVVSPGPASVACSPSPSPLRRSVGGAYAAPRLEVTTSTVRAAIDALQPLLLEGKIQEARASRTAAHDK